MTIEIKYGDIEIVLRRATVRDDLNAQNIQRKLLEDVPIGERGFWQILAEMSAQAVSYKGLPFDPSALISADREPLKSAYECFLDLDKAFKDKVVEALSTLEQPIDRALGTLGKDADPN